MLIPDRKEVNRKNIEVLDEAAVIEWLFGPIATAEPAKPIQNSFASAGPGYLRKWQAFALGKDCFASKKFSPAPPKINILIANALLKDRPPESYELCLMSALPSYYNVHLWQGPSTDLAVRPLNSGDDFWRQREQIAPATTEAIQHWMAEQQIPVKDWLVLDYAAYQERWGEVLHQLDLTQVDLSTPAQLDAVLQSIKADTITSIKLLTPKRATLQFFLHHLPYLRRVELVNLPSVWLEQNIDCFQGSQVKELILEGCTASSIHLNNTYGIERLVLADLSTREVLEISLSDRSATSLKLVVPNYADYTRLTITGRININRKSDEAQAEQTGPSFITEPQIIHINSFEIEQIKYLPAETMFVRIYIKENRSDVGRFLTALFQALPKLKFLGLYDEVIRGVDEDDWLIESASLENLFFHFRHHPAGKKIFIGLCPNLRKFVFSFSSSSCRKKNIHRFMP